MPMRDLMRQPVSRRAVLLTPALLALAACGGSGSGRPAAPAAASSPTAHPQVDFTPKPGLARLEAEKPYFGANLDWGNDSAAAFSERLGAPAASYVQFVAFPLGGNEKQILDQFFTQVLAEGGLAVVTLEPHVALGDISPAMAEDLAGFLGGYNARGAGVLVRFAHEMNGTWYAWSQDPTAYVAAFRLVAEAVHRAPGCGMLWAPNYGGGYPFSGGAYQAKPGTPAYDLLDTNHDGTLDEQDDPYAPYYPGDDAVDWVGLSLYHWGNRYPWGANAVPEANKFADQLSGNYNGQIGDERIVPDFYATYAEGHGKPLAIVETAALFNTTVTGDAELAIKQAWWRQVFDPQVAARFPRIKMINWFEWRKAESEIGGATIDWTATRSQPIREAFRADFPRERFTLGRQA